MGSEEPVGLSSYELSFCLPAAEVKKAAPSQEKSTLNGVTIPPIASTISGQKVSHLSAGGVCRQEASIFSLGWIGLGLGRVLGLVKAALGFSCFLPTSFSETRLLPK